METVRRQREFEQLILNFTTQKIHTFMIELTKKEGLIVFKENIFELYSNKIK